jgi:hypothetical protein
LFLSARRAELPRRALPCYSLGRASPVFKKHDKLSVQVHSQGDCYLESYLLKLYALLSNLLLPARTSTIKFVTTIQTVLMVKNRVVNSFIPVGRSCGIGSIAGHAVVVPLGFPGKIEDDKAVLMGNWFQSPCKTYQEIGEINIEKFPNQLIKSTPFMFYTLGVL